MIQDIDPRKFDNQFRQAEVKENDYIFVFNQKNILVKKDVDVVEFPRFQDINSFEKEDFIYLFSIDEQRYFYLMTDEELSIDGYEYQTMYSQRSREEKYQLMAASTAWHLNVWYRDNRFCGRCGTRTVHDQKQRMVQCPHCGNMIFPKLLPAVIVGVIDGEKLLMTKYANREYTRYALIAGFVEIGESIEETVRREVMEEVGVKVKNIRYFGTQPWGFDQDILVGYFCEADHNREIHMDEEELAVAEWKDRSDVPDYGEMLSLTHEMMRQFKNGKVVSAENGSGIIYK